MKTYTHAEIVELIVQHSKEIAEPSAKIVFDMYLSKVDAPSNEKILNMAETVVKLGNLAQEIFPEMSFKSLSYMSGYLFQENLTAYQLVRKEISAANS